MESATNLRALIVDDDAAIRETLRFALEDAGFTVAEAEDGAMALDTLRSSSERMVVLLDNLMPNLDGLTMLNMVARDDDLARRHAYILLTASPQILPANLDDIYSGIVLSAVSKPFSLDTLQATILDSYHRLPAAS